MYTKDFELIIRLVTSKVFSYLRENPDTTFSLVDLENTLQVTINTPYGKITEALPYIFPCLEGLRGIGAVKKKFKKYPPFYKITPKGREIYKKKRDDREEILETAKFKLTPSN